MRHERREKKKKKRVQFKREYFQRAAQQTLEACVRCSCIGGNATLILSLSKIH